MADKDEKKPAKGKPEKSAKSDPAKSEERFDPKPVQVGGDSIVERLLPHKMKIIGFIVSGFLIWAAIAIVMWVRDRKHAAQTTKIAAVLDVAQHPVEPPAAAGSAEPPKPGEVTFQSAKERANAVLSELAKVGGDVAGPTFHASQLMSAGKLDDAIAEYKKAQNDKGIDGVLAREGLGLALEMQAEQEKIATSRQKGLEDALAAFKAMQPDEKGPMRAYALYHQGRILALLGKRDDAKAALDKAKELAKDPDLGELVDERLAMLGN